MEKNLVLNFSLELRTLILISLDLSKYTKKKDGKLLTFSKNINFFIVFRLHGIYENSNFKNYII